MSESRAQGTFGIKLKKGNDYIANLTSVGEAYSIKINDIDTTDHDSPRGIKQFIPGLAEISDLPIEGHFIPSKACHIALTKEILKRNIEEWTIEYATTPKVTITFRGYLNDFKLNEATTEGKHTFSAAIKAVDIDDIMVDISTGLTNLMVTEGDLAPAFDGGIREYFVTVENEADKIKVTPTAATHTITVNGAKVTSGSPSGDIALAAGAITLITIRAWEEGKAPVIYVIKVYREAGGE